jgi:hypothetical protein
VILDVLALLAANACFLLAGVGVLGLVRGRAGAFTPRAYPGLAYMAGTACAGVLATLLLVAGSALRILDVLLLCGALFLLGAVVARRSRASTVSTAGPRAGWLAAASAALAGAFLLLLAVDLAFQPLFGADAWAQWTPKARAVVLLGGLDPGFFAEPAYLSLNLNYPLLVPALEAVDFRFMRGFDTRVIHLQFWLILAGFLLTLVELSRERLPSFLYAPVVLAVVVAPSVAIQTASAYADVPLAAFFALAGVCGWRWLERADRASLALCGLFSAAALATKLEGAIFVVGLFVVLLVLVARRSLERAAITMLAGVIALAGLVPWRIWLAANETPSLYALDNAFSPRFLAEHVDRLPTAAGRVAQELLDPTSWLLLVPLALAAALVATRFARRRDCVLLFFGTSAIALAGLVWSYWATPFELDFHLDTSARRVVTGPVFFAAALTPFLLAQGLEGARFRASRRSMRTSGAARRVP